MNAKQLNFAYKVRHALNENLDNLPASATEALASARNAALSSKKKEMPRRRFALYHRYSDAVGGYSTKSFSVMARLGFAVPLIVLVTGLAAIFHIEQQQRISDLAELDALVLSDELPLSAYIDHGFNAYLAKRGE
jgi:hypothetical protein